MAPLQYLLRRSGNPSRWSSWVLITVFAALLGMGAAAAWAQEGPLQGGKIAYLRECAGCHGESAFGDGPDAPFLASAPTNLRRSGVLETYRLEALAARIREGQSLALELRPGTLREHARETESLYQFLLRLPGIPWMKVETGQSLYLTRCLPCHDRYGHPVAQPMKGVQKGPRDLADPGFQRAVTDEELRILARHGKAAMPALVPRLRREEVGPLVTFIRLLSPGYENYNRYCQGCHGTDGKGAQGSLAEIHAPHFAFDTSYFAAHDEEQIHAAIWHMLRDAKPQMPHFAATLSERDLEAIVVYLRSLPATTPTEAAE